MDKLDMLELELPSMDGIGDLDHPEREAAAEEMADSAADSAAGAAESGGEEYSYEYEGGDLESMAVPSLSEMDGSELGSPAAKPISLDKPGGTGGTNGLQEMSGTPAFSEMSGGSAGRQTGQYGQPGQYGQTRQAASDNFGNNMSMNGGMQQIGQQGQSGGYGGTGGNTYAPVNHSSVAPNNTQSSPNFYDYMDEDSQLAARGEKTAKIVGIATIVVAVLMGLLLFSARNIIITIYYIYFALRFMKGSQKSRYWLGTGCIITMIYLFISMVQVSNDSAEYVEMFGSSAIVSILQAILLLPTLAYGVLAYFYLLNKSVSAFCKRSGNM